MERKVICITLNSCIKNTCTNQTVSLGTFSGRDRTALAVNQHGGPNLAVCTCIDGKGLALFDLRMPLPLDFVNQVTSLRNFTWALFLRLCNL